MLTEAAIKSAIRRAGETGREITIKDDAPRGMGRLALRARPLPKREGEEKPRVSSLWFAIYFRGGKARLAKIGTYPDLPLAEARAKFRDEYAPAIQAGGEPKSPFVRAVRKKSKSGVTVRELFTRYVERLKAAGKSSAHAVERMLLLRPDSAANRLGPDRLAADVEAADIAAILAEIYERGYRAMALNMRAYIGAAYNFGRKAGNDYRHRGQVQSFGIKSNPVEEIPVDVEARKRGDRVLTEDELRAYWRWLEGQKPKTLFAYAEMLHIILGQRGRELLRIEESGFLRNEAIYEWGADKTKNHRPHAVPLPRMALDLLGELRPNEHGLYFPNRRDPKRRASDGVLEKLCARYIRETGARHFSPRDLRRTWKTLTGKAGLSKDIRDRLQNHARSDVSSKHYDRYDYMKEKRAAMEQWAAYLAGILADDAAEKRAA